MESNRWKEKRRVSFPQVLLKADSMIDEPTNYMSHLRQRRMQLEANRDPISEFLHFAEYVILHTPSESHTLFQRVSLELAALGCKNKKV